MKESLGKTGFENVLRSQSAKETGEAFSEKYEEDIEELKSRVDEDTLAKIEELQAHKLDFVAGLKNWRKKFWDKENRSRAEVLEMSQFEKRPGARPLRIRRDGKFETLDKDRKLVALTKGEVMAAAEWGTWWMFDRSIDSELQKEIMSSQVRYVIAEEFDKQLVAFGKADTESHDLKRDTYERIEERNFNIDKMPPGILSEKMLMSFLTKAMHDGVMKYKIESVDVYEDVEHKIDFIITYQNTVRGVRVGEPMKHIGIQFTTDPHKEKKEFKEKQLKRVRNNNGLREANVDEVVLIVMPLEDVKDKFQQWRYEKNGKRRSKDALDPRGPDMYWDKETKISILKGLVQGIQEADARAA